MTRSLHPPLRRGVALVNEIIARLQLDSSGMTAPWPAGQPVPVPADQLERLLFPNGKPLPPSLRRWLAFDGTWLDLFVDPTAPVFRPYRLDNGTWLDLFADPAAPVFFRPQRLGTHAIDGLRASDDGLTPSDRYWQTVPVPSFAVFEPLLPEDLYWLPLGATTARYLYVGQADPSGEYPIIFTDVDDWYLIGLEAPGLDVYLAWAMGTHGLDAMNKLFEHPDLGPAMHMHAQLNMHGYHWCELFGEAARADGTAAHWHAFSEGDMYARLGYTQTDLDGF